jgi:hypothetical protein
LVRKKYRRNRAQRGCENCSIPYKKYRTEFKPLAFLAALLAIFLCRVKALSDSLKSTIHSQSNRAYPASGRRMESSGWKNICNSEQANDVMPVGNSEMNELSSVY